jgi:hypothetical protein
MDKPQEKTQLEKPVCADVVDLKNDIIEDIESYIINTFNTDNPCNIYQSQFNIALMYIRDKYISMLDIKSNNVFDGYSYNKLDELVKVYSIYIALCQKYNKHICQYGFECISGISQDTLERWLVDKKASRTHKDIAKNIKRLDEETLADFITDGRRNPVGVLAVLNNRHGWSDKRITHISEKPTENLDTIADKIGVNLLSG